jgi:DNA-binding NtrC family response regulator
MMTEFGIHVDSATSTVEALSKLQECRYDVVISDMNRAGISDEGSRFLRRIYGNGSPISAKAVLYVGAVDVTRGTPPFAFGITDRPSPI